MAVPKQRHTKSRRNRRRSHLALKGKSFSVCQKCGEVVLPHHICVNCGFYKGKEIINVLAKLKKKERKNKVRELADKEHEQKAKKPLNPEELSQKS